MHYLTIDLITLSNFRNMALKNWYWLKQISDGVRKGVCFIKFAMLIKNSSSRHSPTYYVHTIVF